MKQGNCVQSLGNRLWNTSPGSLSRAMSRRYRNWRARPAWYTVRAGPLAGAQLLLTRAEKGSWEDMIEGTFDSFFYEELPKHAELKGAVCWDIGAHIGYHSLAFAALGAEVVAFEPNEHNAKVLRMHLEKNPALGRRIRHLALALADHDGEMTFVQSSDMSGASSGSHLETGCEPLKVYPGFDRVGVPVAQIDTLIEARSEKRPAILKIDVEGAEALVLRGGIGLLTSHKPLILMEVHHIRLLLEVQELLLRCGYRIKLLDPDHATPSRCFIMAQAHASTLSVPQ